MTDREYLVTHGLAVSLGRFRAASDHARDDRVVVRTARGLEIGVVLGPAIRSPETMPTGEVVRPAAADDLDRAAALGQQAGRLVREAQALAEALDLPLMILDGEILLDGQEAILEAVHWAGCDATPLFEELSARYGLAVKLADLTTTTPAISSCSRCGAERSGCDSCGTSGGCSTDSCSRGAVKSADELSAYFAGLRTQMESAASRVSLH